MLNVIAINAQKNHDGIITTERKRKHLTLNIENERNDCFELRLHSKGLHVLYYCF